MNQETRLAQELATFAKQEVVHALPTTYNYWSMNYLRPRLKKTGHANFHDMFLSHIGKVAGESAGPIRMVSIGSGNGDFEVMLGKKMVAAGLTDFSFACLDINDVMLERGTRKAAAAGLSDRFQFLNRDFNSWVPDVAYDIVIANHSLHHVTELEHLFDSIWNGLSPNGYFLVNDMIGKNGHMRWPEAEEIIQRIWMTLPDDKKYHHQLRKTFEEFYNHDCSVEGFEGIRAQDILPLLIQKFGFSYFLAFAVIITPFIGRGYGRNYDVRNLEDKRFIDDIALFDQILIDNGSLKPTQMFAALTRQRCSNPVFDRHLTPEFCLRKT